MKTRPRRFVSVAIAGLALFVASCSDDDADTSQPADETGTDASPETSAGDDTAEPAGDPIKIMTVMRLTAENQSTTEEAAEAVAAAVDALNARGGLLGHPIEVVTCDEGGDANAASECARQAVDEGVVAVIGSATAQADAINPILEEAGIANIGGFPSATSDFTSSISFPLGGSPAWIAGCARMLAEAGATNISVVHFDLPAGAFASTFAEQGLTGTDAVVESTVPVPIEAVDYNPLVSAAADDADALLLVLQPEMAGRWLVAARQQGVDLPQCAPGLSNEVVDTVGADAEGVLVAQSTAPVASGGPGIERFVDEVGEELARDFFTPNSWLAVQLFVGAVEAAAPTTIDAASVLAAMRAADGIDLEGVTPPYSTTTPGPGPLAALYNPTFIPAVVEDGEIVSTGDFANPFTG
jgi:ABC-type branched-subunit amino acid transport system substrate-binding protein